MLVAMRSRRASWLGVFCCVLLAVGGSTAACGASSASDAGTAGSSDVPSRVQLPSTSTVRPMGPTIPPTEAPTSGRPRVRFTPDRVVCADGHLRVHVLAPVTVSAPRCVRLGTVIRVTAAPTDLGPWSTPRVSAEGVVRVASAVVTSTGAQRLRLVASGRGTVVLQATAASGPPDAPAAVWSVALRVA